MTIEVSKKIFDINALSQTKDPLLLKKLAFFVGIPLLLATYSTTNNWKLQSDIGISLTLAYYLSHSLIPWLCSCLITKGYFEFLRPWQPNFWVLLIAGNFTASLLTIPYSNMVHDLIGNMAAVNDIGDLAPAGTILERLYFALNPMTQSLIIWLGVNYLFDRFLGLHLYRYTPPTTSNGENEIPGAEGTLTKQNPIDLEVPGFFSRMEKNISLTSLIMVKAEQHYIRVTWDEGEELILYRFSDALRELPPDLGMRVHRSYWINKEAALSVEEAQKKFFITMRNDIKVPVSTPYQELVRAIVGT